VELQNIEENEKYFTGVVFDRFAPKKSPRQLINQKSPKSAIPYWLDGSNRWQLD